MKQKTPPGTYPCKLIEKRGSSALVQYLEEDGEHHRVLIPFTQLVKEGSDYFTEKQNLEWGLSVEAPWEEIIQITTQPDQIIRELKRNGIFTPQDFLGNIPLARSAYNQAVSNDFARIVRALRKDGGLTP